MKAKFSNNGRLLLTNFIWLFIVLKQTVDSNNNMYFEKPSEIRLKIYLLSQEMALILTKKQPAHFLDQSNNSTVWSIRPNYIEPSIVLSAKFIINYFMTHELFRIFRFLEQLSVSVCVAAINNIFFFFGYDWR